MWVKASLLHQAVKDQTPLLGVDGKKIEIFSPLFSTLFTEAGQTFLHELATHKKIRRFNKDIRPLCNRLYIDSKREGDVLPGEKIAIHWVLPKAAPNIDVNVLRVSFNDGPRYETPLQWSVRNSFLDTVMILFTLHKVDPNNKGVIGYEQPPLHLAVKSKSIDMVKILLENGADISTHNWNGPTTLELARETGEKAIEDLLQVHSTMRDNFVKPCFNTF